MCHFRNANRFSENCLSAFPFQSAIYQSNVDKLLTTYGNKRLLIIGLVYMVMGLNQQTTGSYSSDDAALIGQHPVKAEQIEFQTELVKTRIKELEISGYLKFLLTKTVMTFNDGTFNWGREGGYSLNGYPVLSDSSYVASLREIFWPDHKYSEVFGTYCQTIWLISL